ncbi:septal ring factor EnvC (AmiA/AmiB activator) [Silvimonas terrae]|uniref:Septal ring factor EnvC (AmiA/AmiB activator) n=1 Tax=Silvimonas terrae TaxID=300266 RepID=A0A840RG80_9NEIS|nr:peptidoglycan DD-metalloendopeptidase family protein [Silvimonas terrae]MBB5191528.1 septal ring factor EnvC (AmiA/AmiB activator) [Silvimonas terrae]
MPSRSLIIAALFVAAAATLATAAPAISANPADKQEKQDELKDLRGQIDQLKHDLANNESHRKDAADALQQSEKAISDANRVLNDLSGQRALTTAQLARLEVDIARTRSTIRDSQKRLADLLNSRYRTRQLEAWRLVLNEQDPNQTSRELTWYRYLTAAQQQLAQQLQQQLDQLNDVSDRIREKNDELQELARQKAAQKAQLESDQQEKQQVLSTLSQQISSQRNQIGKLQADEKRITTLIARLDAIIKQQELKRAREAAARKKAEAQRLAREEAARKKAAAAGKNKNTAQSANNVNPDSTAAAQSNPTPAPDTAPAQDKVTRQNTEEPDSSQSGQQFAALKGRMRLPLKGEVIGKFGAQRAEGATWKGVFIRAASGLPVKAVASGRVVFADWLRGFGNLMIIDHGGGYMSLYAANESLLKKVGDPVQAGDTIATSGNSGGMGDSGVYFELRQHGKPLDPLSWAG